MNRIESLEVHSFGNGRELGVACPQRTDPVPISTCVKCELCAGLDVDPQSGFVGVRCDAAGESTRGAREATVSSIMTEAVVSVSPDAAIENVRWLMLERGIGAVPVLDEKGRTLGIVSKSDILRDGSEPAYDAIPHEDPLEDGSSERSLSGLAARDVMTPVVYAVSKNASIASAAASMTAHGVHHLPVFDERGALAGIVSTLDLVRWLAASTRFA